MNNNQNDISGFPELSLKEEQIMQKIIEEIKKVYLEFGYNPLETRLIEPLDILLEKGIDGKEVFILDRFCDGKLQSDNKKRKSNDAQSDSIIKEKIYALRFDLTLPFARFVSQQYKTLKFPLKRSQIQKVYRGEASVESRGRYCEFYQSDIDIIGKDTLSLVYDSEFPCVIYKIFRNIFGLDNFVIRINNRKLLEGLFLEYGITDTTKLKKAVSIIDNMEKVELEETVLCLISVGLTEDNIINIRKFFDICRNTKSEILVNALAKLRVKNDLFQQGIKELEYVITNIISCGIPQENFMIDPSIARGLDYYTGTVYETILLDFPYLGSVCSGGRYDNLVGALNNDKTIKFPGCGISIGLTRLIPTLIREGILNAESFITPSVLIAVQHEKYINIYNRIASDLRESGINTSVYYDGGRLVRQFEYASSYGYKIVLIGREELETGQIQVKEMDSGKDNVLVSLTELKDYVKKIFNDNLQKTDKKKYIGKKYREFLHVDENILNEQLQNLFLL
jgi:histidyl-tRNA synthetase